MIYYYELKGREIIHKLKGLTSESYGCENNRNTSWISGLYKLNNVALMLRQFRKGFGVLFRMS